MSALILPRRFYTQPQGRVEVDWSNPLTNGLTELVNPSSLLNETLVRRFTPAISAGTVVGGVGIAGSNVTLPAGTYNAGLIIASGDDDIFPSFTTATIFVVRRALDTTPRASTLFGYNVDNWNRVLCHAPWSDGNLYFDFGGVDSAQRISVAFAKSTGLDHLVFVAGGGKGREVWRNGVKIAGDAAKTGIRAATGANFRIGAADAGFVSDNEEVYQFGVSSRAWSDDEIRSWSANPWQIFKAAPRKLYFDVPADGASLAGTAAAQATTTGSLSVSVPLAGAGLSAATATGALSLSLPLAGAATATASASGGLSLSIPLSGSAVAQALATAGLAQSVPLGGSAASQAAAAGALTLNVSLSGAAIAQAAADAGLTVGAAGSANLVGNAAATASGSGTLSLAVPLSGAALSVASAAGNITQLVPLSGAAAAASFATGGLDVAVTLSGAALAAALASAGLTAVDSGLAGTTQAAASASGGLTLRVNLDGAALAQAVTAGALTADGALTAAAPGYVIRGKARAFVTRITPRTWRV